MATETSLNLEPGKITQRALFINLLILIFFLIAMFYR